MKKSPIALAVLACAAGVASAGQAPPTNIINTQGGALMMLAVTPTVKSTQAPVGPRGIAKVIGGVPGGLIIVFKGGIPDGDGIMKLANVGSKVGVAKVIGGGSGDVTSMKTINGGGSGGITSANGGGSSCLTAVSFASLGTGGTDPSDV